MALIPQSVHWWSSGVGSAHHTWDYAQMKSGSELIVRRGQGFDISIDLNRGYHHLDHILFIFTLVGILYPPRHGHEIFTVPLQRSGVNGATWSATLEAELERAIKVKIFPPANAPIGKWKVDLSIQPQSPRSKIYYNVLSFKLIFNPWCRDDQVYLNDEQARQEYVLEDTGLIWGGDNDRLESIYWKYSQFHAGILDVAFYLMGQVPRDSRNNPVAISRALSAAMNYEEDNGVLVGRWDGNYRDGVAPQNWFDSKDILLQYYNTKRPVKYGQCWVFAGIYTTISRALGLPCRPITNYISLHDSNGDLRVEEYYDQNGRVVERLSRERIWNFHVWCEVWMKRPDLKVQYDGWQAVDSTAQELSAGHFQCGPAPVTAVKEGDFNCYDCKLFFAAVNADLYRRSATGRDHRYFGVDKTIIGANISTKAIGAWNRKDITHTYKYRTYSIMYLYIRAWINYLENLRERNGLTNFNDIHFDLILPTNSRLGQTFRIELSMRNINRQKSYTISPSLVVFTEIYNGLEERVIEFYTPNDVTVRSGMTYTIYVDITPEKYRSFGQSNFKIIGYAQIKSTGFQYYKPADLLLRNP